jgi:hypothetical protein
MVINYLFCVSELTSSQDEVVGAERARFYLIVGTKPVLKKKTFFKSLSLLNNKFFDFRCNVLSIKTLQHKELLFAIL